MMSNGVNDVKKHHLSCAYGVKWCQNWHHLASFSCQKWCMVSKMVLNDVKKTRFVMVLMMSNDVKKMSKMSENGVNGVKVVKKWCLWCQMMSNDDKK